VEHDRAPAFSFITSNWPGKPLTELATIVNLIASTTTCSDLLVFAGLDEGSYPAKVTVSDAELEAVNLHGHAFHPEWKYTREPASTYLAPPNSSC
jgi:hypothetical protein